MDRSVTRTLEQQVYATLRQWLVVGSLVPGEKLSLRTIAARLEVSVQPVRGAVARLVADAALEVLPNRAVRVPVIDAPRFDELTLIRLGIEGFAAQRAAQVRDASQLAAIRLHEAAFRAQAQRRVPDAAEAIAANQRLHFAVYAAAGLPTLMPIIEGLWLRIGPLINFDLRSAAALENFAKSVRCHAAMVDGIARGDAEAARRGLVDDIEGAAKRIAMRLAGGAPPLALSASQPSAARGRGGRTREA